MNKIIEIYRYFSDKRYSTISGTLVYFFLMSIAPFTLWLTLVCGNIDLQSFLNHRLLESVSPILSYMKVSAEKAVSSAGIILLATTLYSSTSFFYHLRRSGEIIYDSKRTKGGIKLRLASLLLIFAVYTAVAVIATLYVASFSMLDRFMPHLLVQIITYSIIVIFAFFVALILNIFACPYKIKPFEAVVGSLLTVAMWLVCAIGFNMYTHFARPEKLYGKIASVIVFLLWCYVMMNCFVIGVIYNGMNKTNVVYKKVF